MNIQQRILLGPLVAVLLLLVFGAVAYQAIQSQSRAMQEIKETRFEQFRASAEMAERLSKVHVQLFGLVTWYSAYDKATQDRMIREIPTAQAKLIEDFRAWQADARNTPEENRKMAEIAGLLDQYRKEMDAAINMVQIDVTSALGDMKAVARHFTALEKAFDELSALQRQLADKTYIDAQAGTRLALSINLVVLVLAIGIAGALGFLTARQLLKQLGGEPALAVEIAGRIAEGDLSVAVPPAPAGSLIGAMRTMRDGLRQTMTRMSENAVALSASAEQVASAAGQVAQRSSEQNDAAASMAAAIEEMSTSIGTVAESAKGAASTSTHSGATAEEGSGIVLEAAREMENIAQSVEGVSAAIRTLNQHAGEISSVVTVISEVAAQTNLLALNAAIEAARAGEQGRGFAVVADEVRKLAERTTTSTHEITSMIAGIQSSSSGAISAMDAAGTRVAVGVALARNAGTAIEKIRTEADQVLASVNEIADSLREQGAVTNDIANHVERIARMSEDNSALAGESASAASQLRSLAASMRDDVRRFKL